MNVEARIKIERRIVTKAIDDALAAGYKLGVNDGERTTLKNCQDGDEVLEALFTTDEDRLYYWMNDVCVGWVYLVYGNNGYDVINDYTVNLEEVLKGATDLANEIEEQS